MAYRCLILFLLVSATAVARDVDVGHWMDALMRGGYVVLEDEELDARARAVLRKIVDASGNPNGYEWRLAILNSPEPQAFAGAGGYVYITSGLLRTLESEGELAAVLAHEVGHNNARHVLKDMSAQRRSSFWTASILIGAQLAGAMVGAAAQRALASPGISAYALNRMSGGLGAVATFAVSSGGAVVLNAIYWGHGESQEFQADDLAMRYAHSAGYNRGALSVVLSRLLTLSNAERAREHVSYLHSSKQMLLGRIARLQRGGIQ